MNDSEAWLRAWHDAMPGATSLAFSRGVPSTYERLAAIARPGDDVLDLACGDGFLLERLLDQGVRSAVGLDLSAGELDAARARVGDRAALVRGRGQALPFPDAAFDLVTCHMALMLMTPLAPVIDEVRRVLRPGGRFAAVVGAGAGGAWAVLVDRLRPLAMSGPRLGDPATRSEDGLRRLLSVFAAVDFESIDVVLDGTADELWQLFELSYDASRMSAADRDAVESDVRATWAARAGPVGVLPCAIGARLFVATR